MSTNTLVSDFIAEHDAKQRKQPLPTPKEVHARMIEMTNAANGLRYEVARFGDIERQLKAVHEKMEPLVLKAKELNDLVCERVSQASQPWANSGIHESEELLQKVQQLEHENAALRADVLEQCMVNAKGGEREYSLRGRIEQLERENAALLEQVHLANSEIDQWASRCAAAIWMLPETVTGGQLREAQDKFHQMLHAARAKEAKP